MKALRVDFVARRPIGVGPWITLVVALSGLVAYECWLGWQQEVRLRALRKEQVALVEKVEAAEEKRRQLAAERDVRPPYFADALTIANMAAFPWGGMLASLESAQVLGVKVTALEATAADGNVRIELEFADHASLLAYIEAINAGEPSPRWLLVQAQMASTASIGNSATLASNWISGAK